MAKNVSPVTVAVEVTYRVLVEVVEEIANDLPGNKDLVLKMSARQLAEDPSAALRLTSSIWPVQ